MLNLTPHEIVIRTEAGEFRFPPSGTVARVQTIEMVVGTLESFPVIRREMGQAEGLPDPSIPCLVSAMVLSAVPNRPNTFAPDSGPTAIRNEKGQIIAVTRLVAA
jgi:hypothetical protein